MSELADQLNEMRTLAYAKQATRRSAGYRGRDLDRGVQEDRRATLLSMCRTMQLWEYAAWLTGFMKAGGKPTHFYEYPTPVGGWFTAEQDFVALPLYGALAVNIIVPASVNLLGGDTGHSDLFVTTAEGAFLHQGFHDMRPHAAPRVVPVYTDTEVLA